MQASDAAAAAMDASASFSASESPSPSASVTLGTLHGAASSFASAQAWAWALIGNFSHPSDTMINVILALLKVALALLLLLLCVHLTAKILTTLTSMARAATIVAIAGVVVWIVLNSWYTKSAVCNKPGWIPDSAAGWVQWVFTDSFCAGV